jgi:hypothetical protein
MAFGSMDSPKNNFNPLRGKISCVSNKSVLQYSLSNIKFKEINIMKTYAQKSSAIRAIKVTHGDSWSDYCEVVEIEGKFAVVAKVQTPATPEPKLLKELKTLEFVTEHEAKTVNSKAKAKEIASRKPVHIPAAPIHEAVAEKIPAIPAPPLPSFLQIASPAISAVPAVPKTITPALVSAAADAIEEFGEDELERFAEAQRQAADRLANAQAANTEPLRPRVSSIKLPTKKVWDIADNMYAAAAKNNSPSPKRSEVIEECVRQGIAYGTARTQFQHWFKCITDLKTAPIATIGADGKISMAAKN